MVVNLLRIFTIVEYPFFYFWNFSGDNDRSQGQRVDKPNEVVYYQI